MFYSEILQVLNLDLLSNVEETNIDFTTREAFAGPYTD